MKMSKLPASLRLVGIFFICICACSASSVPQLDVNEQLNKFKDNSETIVLDIKMENHFKFIELVLSCEKIILIHSLIP